MKKFVVSIAVVAICLIACFGFASCDKTQELPKDNALPNLADCEIGYQFMVYPNTSFSYQMLDFYDNPMEGYIINIESMTATLVDKKVLNKGDLLQDEYYNPYIIEFNIKGFTDPTFARRDVSVSLSTMGLGTLYFSTIISENGRFEIVKRYGVPFATNFSFRRCE